MPVKKNHDKGNYSVLIIEDEIDLVELLESKFSQFGFDTYHAFNVPEARQILTLNLPNVIILDVMLPGINGLSLLTELKANKKFQNIPVLVTSNLGQEEEIQKGMNAGASEYIVKANTTPEEIVKKALRHITNKK